MAYRISQPLAATQFQDDKKKNKSKRRQVKNITQKGGPIRKLITTKGGREKTITTSRDGTKRTVEKVSRKGKVKSRTSEIDLAKGQVTTTKRKGGRVVKKKTSKELTPQQARQLSVSPGGLKSKVKSNVKRAERVNDQDTDNKANKQARLKKQREKDKAYRQEKRYRKKRRNEISKGKSAQMGSKNRKGRVDPNQGTAGQNKRKTKKSCKDNPNSPGCK